MAFKESFLYYEKLVTLKFLWLNLWQMDVDEKEMESLLQLRQAHFDEARKIAHKSVSEQDIAKYKEFYDKHPSQRPFPG